MKYYNIPVFVSHQGCPFDCVFCNQRKITGDEGDISREKCEKIISVHLEMLPLDSEKEIAFFGGSFTGIEVKKQEELLSVAYEYVKKKSVSGIRISTRPDYIDEGVMERLTSYGVSTIEIGVQSMDDEVLKKSGRGHTAEDVEKATSIIKKYPSVKLGLQMMIGLPGDTEEKALLTAEKIIAQHPDFVRIYPTLVIKNTRLADMCKSGEYKPLDVDEAVEISYKLIEKFNSHGIEIIRVGLQNTDEISPDGAVLAGPYHSAFGELAESRVYYEKIKEAIKDKNEDEIVVFVNPREVSKAVGHKRENIEKIKKEFNKTIKISTSEEIEKYKIRIESR